MAVTGSVRSPWWAVLLLGVWMSLSAIWFVSLWFPMDTLRQLQQATAGWVSVTLVASGAIGMVSLLIVFGLGRQSFADVGWRAGYLVPAFVVSLLLWASMQAATVFSAQVSGAPLVAAAAWERGLGIALGPLLAQVLGTALMEETVFRGYLWPQLVLWLRRGLPAAWAAALGLLLSQGLFAGLHVPVLLYTGTEAGALAGPLLMLFFVGIVFALVYAATGNLFVAVGAHALGNAPTLLFEPQGPAPSMVLLIVLVVLSTGYWAWNQRRAGGREGAGTASDWRGFTRVLRPR
ncbi:hypothetical protein IP93_01286 [Lysobacter ruishenii]|uniref:CAAX prenyl protease 2/Lysostaphin resistance protein A-like domain-containing protein n=2 Tax=Aerolutibacter ruishenii TaxID=686800 RepID=A0A562LWI7_9GAMM|nr:hypothetical protein IP93_01286 [Lysobacter ruishenii]